MPADIAFLMMLTLALVKLQMQDAAYGTAPGYKVSWVSSESKRVDSQRLRKEQPDIFNQYSKNVSSRRLTIVHAA